jgi:hypothetical protein
MRIDISPEQKEWLESATIQQLKDQIDDINITTNRQDSEYRLFLKKICQQELNKRL